MPDSSPPTPFQTLGPFYPPDLVGDGDADLTWRHDPARRARGRHLVLHGRVSESGAQARVGAVVEIWQADAQGRFPHPLDPRGADADPDFAGWGRAVTDGDGLYRFVTVRPGGYRDPITRRDRPPHVNLQIVSSGVMRRLVTTLFFPDAPDNDADPVLEAVPEVRRGRLLARPDGTCPVAGLPRLRFDIVLSGDGETPFLRD